MLKITCIASSYPTHLKYWRGTFVENFCEALQKVGADVEVIVPEGSQNILVEWLWLRLGLRKSRARRVPFAYAPCLSLSRLGFRFALLGRLNRFFQERAVYKALSQQKAKPDVVYAHFLGNGLSAHRWCKEHGVRLVVVSGESSYEHFYRSINRERVTYFLRDLSHLFFVSEKNQAAFQASFGESFQRSTILPNAVDTEKFHPGDKASLRQELDLPQNVRIVGFLGYFIERKGPLRLLKAIEKIDNLYGVFIGTGAQKPSGERVLFAGRMENDEVPRWLAACDVFALPSLHEGRSNAIIEALACGLPVVVSDRSFNREFLNEECAVYVDPEAADDIARGLRQVLELEANKQELSRAARELASNYSLARRAQTFLDTLF